MINLGIAPRPGLDLCDTCLRCHGTASMPRPFRLRIDLHGTRHASHQADALRYLIDVDAYRHTLRKAHPGKDRIYRGEPCGVRLCVRDLDATGDTADMATNGLAVAHQFDGRRVALIDTGETRLLEVTINPEGIGVYD